MPLYPVNISIEGRLCLVVGGGKVAVRKVESLLPCGARVQLISPEVESRIAELAGKGLLQWIKRKYKPGDLQGAMLVFAATDNEQVQEAVFTEANTLEIPVNVISHPEECTFQIPASMRQGDLLLTVATGGASPALAARIRQKLEGQFGVEYGQLVALMAAVRKAILASGGTQKEHKLIFERILDSDIVDYLKTGQWLETEKLLKSILPPFCDVAVLLDGIRN